MSGRLLQEIFSLLIAAINSQSVRWHGNQPPRTAPPEHPKTRPNHLRPRDTLGVSSMVGVPLAGTLRACASLRRALIGQFISGTPPLATMLSAMPDIPTGSLPWHGRPMDNISPPLAAIRQCRSGWRSNTPRLSDTQWHCRTQKFCPRHSPFSLSRLGPRTLKILRDTCLFTF